MGRILLLGCVAGLLASPASATVVEWRILATVDRVLDDFGLLPPGLEREGATLEVLYRFEEDAGLDEFDLDPDGPGGVFALFHPRTEPAFEVQLADLLHFTQPRSDDVSELWMFPDRLSVASGGQDGILNGGAVPVGFGSIDLLATFGEDAFLPHFEPPAPSPPRVPPPSFQEGRASLSLSGIGGEIGSLHVSGEIRSIARVPEPTCTLLLGIAAGLGVLTRSSRR